MMKLNVMKIMLEIPAASRLVSALIFVLLITSCGFAGQPRSAAEPLEVDSIVLRLIAEAEIPAQEAGVITAIPVRDGQRVKRGELLAQIDDRVARLAEQASARQFEIAQAEANNDVRRRYALKALEVSEAELRRSTESIERFPKSVSESQLDVERLTVQKNRLEAEQAAHEAHIASLEMNAKKNELQAAQNQVARRRIVAPFDGVIVQVYARLGEWVEPGQKALRIVNIDQLKAEGFIPADQAGEQLVGAPVQLMIGAPDDQTTFAGRVVFVSPEVDPITHQVRVWAEIDNKDGRLRPGLPAKMIIAGEAIAQAP